jgi:hypothetical protein
MDRPADRQDIPRLRENRTYLADSNKSDLMPHFPLAIDVV